MPAILAIALGGATGSVIRYLISLRLNENYLHALRLSSTDLNRHLPWGTIAVNLAGCLLIGILAAVLDEDHHATTRLFLITGFLGGFTTFSAFGLETFHLLSASRYMAAFSYLAISGVGGLTLTAIGYVAIRQLAG